MVIIGLLLRRVALQAPGGRTGRCDPDIGRNIFCLRPYEPRLDSSRIETIPLSPRLGDFNEDLAAFGLNELRALVRPQVTPDDVERFLLARPSGRL
jgi:hypothetical protein